MLLLPLGFLSPAAFLCKHGFECGLGLLGQLEEVPAAEAGSRDLRLEVVKHPGAKKGFVLLPRWWVVECSFARATRFRSLAKDYERLAETVAGLCAM